MMKEQVMNGFSGRSGFLIRLFGTLFALVLLVYLLSQQGWGEIAAAIRGIPAWRLGLAVLFMLISRLAVSGRWYMLLRSGGIRISLPDTLRITFAGLFASNFLPTTIGGDVIRLAGALQLKLDAAISAASLIVDRLVGMAGMAMLLPFGVPEFLDAQTLRGAGLLNASLLAGFGALPVRKWMGTGWQKGMKIFRRISSALALWLKQPRALLFSLFFTWIHMICLFGVISMVLQGMGEHIPFLLIGGLYSIVYFVTLLPFSINGYGIQEVSMTLIFSSVGGASVQSGLTAALLFRTIMMLASTPGFIFVPGLLPGAKKRGNVTTGAGHKAG